MKALLFYIWHTFLHGYKNQVDEVTDYGSHKNIKLICLKCHAIYWEVLDEY